MFAFSLADLAKDGPYTIHELRRRVKKIGKTQGRLVLAGKSIPCFKDGVRWIVWQADWEAAKAMPDESAGPAARTPAPKTKVRRLPIAVNRRFTS